MIIVMIVMIALKGANRDFSNLLPAPRIVSYAYAPVVRHNCVQITCNTSSVYHVQLIVCHVVRRDSAAAVCDRVEIAFILAFS